MMILIMQINRRNTEFGRFWKLKNEQQWGSASVRLTPFAATSCRGHLWFARVRRQWVVHCLQGMTLDCSWTKESRWVRVVLQRAKSSVAPFFHPRVSCDPLRAARDVLYSYVLNVVGRACFCPACCDWPQTSSAQSARYSVTMTNGDTQHSPQMTTWQPACFFYFHFLLFQGAGPPWLLMWRKLLWYL